MTLKQNAAMIRGDQERRFKIGRALPHYKIVENDILLLTGPYRDQYVRSLWSMGGKERDYIYQYLYLTKDPEVERIIKQCFCQ